MAGSDPWEAILERIEDGASLIGLDAGHAADALVAGEDARGRRADPPRQRRDRGVPGMAGAPQQCAGARQGRHPLPPVGQCARGHGARCRHDPQVRRGRRALRGRQGRRPGRPDDALGERARAPHAPLRDGHRLDDRPGPGRAGAGRQHRRQRDGVADGHDLDGERGGYDRRRDRQAARDRRQPRPCRRHLPGRAHLHPAGVPGARPLDDRGARRDPRARQGRRPPRVHAATRPACAW